MKNSIIEEVRRVRQAQYLERQRDPEGFERRMSQHLAELKARAKSTLVEGWDDFTLPRVARMIRQRKRAERLAKEAAAQAGATQQPDVPV